MAENTVRNHWLTYIGAIVLGMNDALVEMTGALAGFTMALGENTLITLAGLTTGVAATLSMAASEFLSLEAAETKKRPWKAALYTGISYLLTVAILLLPYFFFSSPYLALAVCLLLAALIILVFTYTVARVRQRCFIKDFLRMLTISFGVAACAFLISWLAKIWWGIDV